MKTETLVPALDWTAGFLTATNFVRTAGANMHRFENFELGEGTKFRYDFEFEPTTSREDICEAVRKGLIEKVHKDIGSREVELLSCTACYENTRPDQSDNRLKITTFLRFRYLS